MVADSSNNAATDDQKRSSVADFLQIPRKKRKNFVIFALGPAFDRERTGEMIQYVKNAYPNFGVAQPKDLLELRRMFGRKISLLVVDDELAPLDVLISSIRDLKVRRKEDRIPVTFLTRHPQDLIETYHKVLAPFHEGDDYMRYDHMRLPEILDRLKIGVDQQNRRRSRRYVVNLPVSFFHLGRQQNYQGFLIDVSLHGARLKVNSKDFVFNDGDQMNISIPINQFLPHYEGDFIRIAARTKRVHLIGDTAAVSFEHVSENQFVKLTQLIAKLIKLQVTKQHRRYKTKQGL